MTVENASEWLVIINSVVLAVFLVLAIVTMIVLLVLLARVRKLVDKAERVTDTIESVGAAIKQATEAVTFSRVLNTVFRTFNKQGGQASKRR